MLQDEQCFWVIEYRWDENPWKYLLGSTHAEFFAAEKELEVLVKQWRGQKIEFRSAKYGPVHTGSDPKSE